MGRLLIGVNIPDSTDPLPESFWSAITPLGLDQFTLSSRSNVHTLDRLIECFPTALIHVRPCVGSDPRRWPRHILDYRPEMQTPSLGECLDRLCTGHPGQVLWVGGAQLTIPGLNCRVPKHPEDVWPPHLESIRAYADWWHDSVADVRRHFPSVPVAVAPLSQGSPVLEWRWFHALKSLGCYDQATYLADHNRFLNRPFADPNWGSRGIALRELLPELGPIHNLEAHDGGQLLALGAEAQAVAFDRYLQWCARQGSFACVSLLPPDIAIRPWIASSLPLLAHLFHRSHQAAA
jgi:hypothetical protein